MSFYITRGADGNRTNYSRAPQYSGQSPMTHDFAAACPECGGSVERVTSFPQYLAHCAKGHRWPETLILPPQSKP